MLKRKGGTGKKKISSYNGSSGLVDRPLHCCSL